MNKEDFAKFAKLMEYGELALEQEIDKDIEFECPNCGNTAHAFRTSYNQHMSVYCSNCKMTTQE